MRRIEPGKPKSIWTKNLFTETAIGRAVTPFFVLILAGFFIFQAVSGLWFEKAVIVGKLANTYTYQGDNARLVGLAYLSVVLMFGSYLFKDFAEKLQLRVLFNLIIIFFAMVFIISLTVAVSREAF